MCIVQVSARHCRQLPDAPSVSCEGDAQNWRWEFTWERTPARYRRTDELAERGGMMATENIEQTDARWGGPRLDQPGTL